MSGTECSIIVEIPSVPLDATTELDTHLLKLILEYVFPNSERSVITADMNTYCIALVIESPKTYVLIQARIEILGLPDVHVPRLGQVVEDVHTLVLIAVVNQDGCLARQHTPASRAGRGRVCLAHGPASLRSPDRKYLTGLQGSQLCTV